MKEKQGDVCCSWHGFRFSLEFAMVSFSQCIDCEPESRLRVNKRKAQSEHISSAGHPGPVVTRALLVPTFRESRGRLGLNRSRPHGHARPDADRALQGLPPPQRLVRGIPALSPRDVLPAALDRPRRSLSRLDRRGGETVAVRQNFIGNFAHPAEGFFCETPFGGKAIR